MDITVNQITPRREGGDIVAILVHFTAKTDDGLINLTGTVPISTDNFDLEDVKAEVKQELADKILNGEGDLNAE